MTGVADTGQSPVGSWQAGERGGGQRGAGAEGCHVSTVLTLGVFPDNSLVPSLLVLCPLILGPMSLARTMFMFQGHSCSSGLLLSTACLGLFVPIWSARVTPTPQRLDSQSPIDQVHSHLIGGGGDPRRKVPSLQSIKSLGLCPSIALGLGHT